MHCPPGTLKASEHIEPIIRAGAGVLVETPLRAKRRRDRPSPGRTKKAADPEGPAELPPRRSDEKQKPRPPFRAPGLLPESAVRGQAQLMVAVLRRSAMKG